VLAARDVGHRVVVRRYAGVGPHGRPLFTDLLGELLTIDEDRIVVRTDDGVEQTVPREEVGAAKRIPPRPVRYSEIIALERIADEAWPAPVHERLGDWFLRAAEGWTNRANSALPLGDPGIPLDAAISTCQSWYAARGLTPRITVPLPLRRDVAQALTVRGWHAQPFVLVQTAPLSNVLVPVAPQVELLKAPSADFLKIVAMRKASLPEAAWHVLTALSEVRFAEVRGDNGALLAIARGAMVDSWLHLGLVEVIESARSRGYARGLTQALAGWATQRGATRALLQVEEQNTAGVALYKRMGFTTHHRYATFRAPSSA